MPTDYSQRPLGHIPSKPDLRDHQIPRYSSVSSAVTLPPLYTVPNQPPIRDQMQTPTCVGHALGALLEQGAAVKGFLRSLSPIWIYNGARSLETPPPAEGTSLRDALLFLQQHGAAPEADQPFNNGAPGLPLPHAASDALLTRAGGWAVVSLLPMDIKAALARNQSNLVAALEVTPGFDSPDSAGMMTPGGNSRGSHAICIVGYDDARQAFRIRNSWGTGWGQSGYAWRPYAMPFTEVYTATTVALATLPAPRPWWAFWLP